MVASCISAIEVETLDSLRSTWTVFALSPVAGHQREKTGNLFSINLIQYHQNQSINLFYSGEWGPAPRNTPPSWQEIWRWLMVEMIKSCLYVWIRTPCDPRDLQLFYFYILIVAQTGNTTELTVRWYHRMMTFRPAERELTQCSSL